MLPSVGAHLFASPARATQLQACGSPRIFCRESAGHKRGGSLVQVVLHLVGDILIGGWSIEEYVETAGDLAPERHAA